MMKKLAVFLVCALLLCGCGANEAAVTDDAFIQKVMNLEEAVSAYLLDDNEGSYLIGECRGEGHLVLGTEEKEEETVVYLLTMYGEYGFTNDKFIKVSGSGVIPAVMKLEKIESGFKGKSIKYPEDGAGYTDSIKKMFPLRYHAATLTVADTYYDEGIDNQLQEAIKYLGTIHESGSE